MSRAKRCDAEPDEIPAVLCCHANECPSVCPCPPNCYCRRVGSAPACRSRRTKATKTGEGLYLLLDSTLMAPVEDLETTVLPAQLLVSIREQRRTVTFIFRDGSSMTGEVLIPAGKIAMRPCSPFVLKGNFNAKAKDQKRHKPNRRKNPSSRMPAQRSRHLN